MEANNSILNALLQQMYAANTNNHNNQGISSASSVNPVNLSMSSNDERAEVTSSSSSAEEESPADLSSSHRRHLLHHDHTASDSSDQANLRQLHPDYFQAMAAALSYHRDLIQQQQQQQQQQGSVSNSSSPGPDPSHLVAKALASATMRRPRSEKKPIPDDLKDNKYYERRRRNNLAAKRSRDMRKTREDQVTVRANILEQENSVLRAQVATLRDEAYALKQMLLQKQASAIMRSQAATS